MAYLHCRIRTRILTQVWTANAMATLYCIETSHCTDSNSHSNLDPDPPSLLYPFLGRIFVPRSGLSGKVNKPLIFSYKLLIYFCTYLWKRWPHSSLRADSIFSQQMAHSSLLFSSSSGVAMGNLQIRKIYSAYNYCVSIVK